MKFCPSCQSTTKVDLKNATFVCTNCHEATPIKGLEELRREKTYIASDPSIYDLNLSARDKINARVDKQCEKCKSPFMVSAQLHDSFVLVCDCGRLETNVPE